MKNLLKKLISILMCFIMVLSIASLKTDVVQAKEKDVIPKMDIVSLEHFPFIEGQENSIYASCNNYTGKVQYQAFYMGENTMNSWELVNNKDMVDGWTKSIEANKFAVLNISDLNLKPDYYKFAIRVKRDGVQGKYKNKYGSYDDVYAFSTVVKKIEKEIKNEVIEVSNAKELLENIGSNKTIKLKAGEYDLLAVKDLNNKHIKFEKVFDGQQLVVSDISNLTIEGLKDAQVKLLVNPRYANVLTFKNSNNINISNIIAGHYPDKGSCTGGVFFFDNCKNVDIKNSVLFGCGTEGINLNKVENFNFENSTIKECSYDLMTLLDSKNIVFKDSNFYDTVEFNLINVSNTKGVIFDKCNIYNNKATGEFFPYLFNVDENSNVLVKNCIIKDNKVKSLVSNKEAVIFENVEFHNNTFDKK
ncbi:right-handed parallel beta-helix repeat-containing protein [Clostridium tagluense]|uniref:right-handed parallel beta-helix repeat-containing protein n=1 Tax=Clostridium tagluense TaxID=360422 RepID=UPI001C6E25C8|nr:right-handed parallel beta-helix repeat-containing protein [Clostridium tagluense]MBW9158840.1 right-handed parallel beta-helix repeat-containing protein [Clostridium tagluense]WLC65805.1 right-handed parallel beta-helix repeat-containing protein [Clostridium tagluense]